MPVAERVALGDDHFPVRPKRTQNHPRVSRPKQKRGAVHPGGDGSDVMHANRKSLAGVAYANQPAPPPP